MEKTSIDSAMGNRIVQAFMGIRNSIHGFLSPHYIPHSRNFKQGASDVGNPFPLTPYTV